jgi:protein ImuA
LTCVPFSGINKNKDRTFYEKETAMASAATARGVLCRLRRDIARIEGRLAAADRLAFASEGGVGEDSDAVAGQSGGLETPAGGLAERFSLGLPALDAVLGGGLARAALHEVRAAQSRDEPAASGFALALVARLCAQQDAAADGTMKPAGRSLDRAPDILWISEAGSRREAGALYAPGLAALGLDPGRIVQVAARRPGEALWAFEAGLSCAGLAAVICQVRRPHERGPDKAFDLAATRRLALKAREAGVCGLLVRLAAPAEPGATQTRWRVIAAPSGAAVSRPFGGAAGHFSSGIGRTAWHLRLEKNRGGRTGAFTVEWNPHEHCFERPGGGAGRKGAPAHPQPVAALSSHRPAAA